MRNLAMNFILICIFGCCLGCDNVTYTKGSLYAENRDFDVGNVVKSENMQKKFYFDLTNHSDTIIHIKKIDVSCGCVQINEYPKIVNPIANAMMILLLNIVE